MLGKSRLKPAPVWTPVIAGDDRLLLVDYWGNTSERVTSTAIGLPLYKGDE